MATDMSGSMYASSLCRFFSLRYLAQYRIMHGTPTCRVATQFLLTTNLGRCHMRTLGCREYAESIRGVCEGPSLQEARVFNDRMQRGRACV